MANQSKVEERTACSIEIRRLLGRQLKRPLVAVVESARPGFKAHVAGISIFGYGDDAAGAFQALQEGIESVCRDRGDLDIGAAIQRRLLLENLMTGEERAAQKQSSGN